MRSEDEVRRKLERLEELRSRVDEEDIDPVMSTINEEWARVLRWVLEEGEE